ncbi:hypothetical protein SH668x_002668 [Planctomicrobium sp. SH668]|uniref:hypothetical protein n=1 Tax=Planctomicrobium sp. SH668 TaxID=3448126 RepID=UPI003F5C0833
MNSTTNPRQVVTSRSDGLTESSQMICLLLIIVSMSIMTAKLFDAPVLRSANDRSRWCTVYSIVEQNKYEIDEIRQVPGWDTIDIVRHNDHFYSSKPPLLPRIVAELYRSIKFVTGWTLLDHRDEIVRICLFLINIVPMGIALAYFSKFIGTYTRDPWSHIFIVATACFGAMYLPYLTVFNNHTPAVVAAMVAIPLAVQIVVDMRQSVWRYFVCGLFTAFCVCNELPAALFGVAIFFMLFHESPVKTLSGFFPAALIVLVAFFLTNYEATGSWQPFYAKYGTETYNFVFEGVPSYWTNPRGIDRPRDSTAVYLLHCTFGHHGIFSLSPIFLVMPAGWFFPSIYLRSSLSKFQILGAVLTVVTLGFYLTKTENYNYSGVSVALRWMLWLIPFWLMALIPSFNILGKRIWFRRLTMGLLGISIFSAYYPANSPWAQNWIYQLMANSRLMDYSDPPEKFNRQHYSWIGSLPDGELQPNYGVEFQATNPDGTLQTLRLQDGGPHEETGRVLIVTQTGAPSAEEKQVSYVLDRIAFSEGKPVLEFLKSRGDGAQLTDEDYRFFQGIPQGKQYSSSRIRYDKVELRTDAFRCHIGYSAAKVEGADGIARHQIRDVWYCDEIPFGVLKFEDRVEQIDTKQIVRRAPWKAVRVGEYLVRAKQSPF